MTVNQLRKLKMIIAVKRLRKLLAPFLMQRFLSETPVEVFEDDERIASRLMQLRYGWDKFLITLLGASYPLDADEVRNMISDMEVTCLEGEVRFMSEGGEIVLTPGKRIFIPKLLWYHWRSRPGSKMLIEANPPWQSGQQERRSRSA